MACRGTALLTFYFYRKLYAVCSFIVESLPLLRDQPSVGSEMKPPSLGRKAGYVLLGQGYLTYRGAVTDGYGGAMVE
jgi:hypothetical protein